MLTKWYKLILLENGKHEKCKRWTNGKRKHMSKRWTDSERTMSVQWKNKLKNRTLLATNIIQ